MKKIIVLALFISACSQQAWQNFTGNPLAYIQQYESDIQIFLNMAEGVIQVVLPLIATDKQPKLLADYNNGVAAVLHAETALNDAVKAAMDAKTPNPDFTKLIADVTAAVDQIEIVITNIKAIANGNNNLNANYDDLKHIQKTIHSFH